MRLINKNILISVCAFFDNTIQLSDGPEIGSSNFELDIELQIIY